MAGTNEIFSELFDTKKGAGMNPILGQALIELGSGLFESILSGAGRKAEDKRRWGRFMKRMDLIKPKGKYSRGIDPVTARALENMFANRGMNSPQYEETRGRI